MTLKGPPRPSERVKSLSCPPQLGRIPVEANFRPPHNGAAKNDLTTARKQREELITGTSLSNADF